MTLSKFSLATAVKTNEFVILESFRTGLAFSRSTGKQQDC